MLVSSDLAPRFSRLAAARVEEPAFTPAGKAPRLRRHGGSRAVAGRARLAAHAYRDADSWGDYDSAHMMDAALGAIFDAEGVQPDEREVGPGLDGLVVIVESGHRSAGLDELRRLIMLEHAHASMRYAAVGVVVIGASAATAAIDVDFLARSVRNLGGYVVGGAGTVVTKRDAGTETSWDGTPQFSDVTLASNISLLGRRVATLARSGHALRAA
ncbi:hypothetical protein P3H15_24590 [Rhodococcus sp. T2V]|uniref:hypothetical protein n=1 Tax=Rhodococcus sp. T2V TaxID=3034164 RepID=UPI0023E216A9|nr:hypothetical protein [Rhodococcus sp. T2V]MDF3308199.1 hypothetical protein [Rhodococcus sp. T2V]